MPVEGSTDILLYSLDSLQLPQGMILDVFGSDRRVVLTSSISAIRLMNAAPQSGQIYGLFDGTTFTAALDYTVRSGYGYQATGQHVITIEASSAPGATIATIERMFESARDVTIVVAGLPGAVQAFAVPDANSPPPPDLARLRYVNAVSDNAAYDVFVGDTKQVSALAARTASIYFDVAPGTLVVTFRDPATGAVALPVPAVSLSNGSIRTIYATGTAGQMNSLPAIDRCACGTPGRGGAPMLLMIDNYDSFTWNLVQYLGELGADVHVHRNDAISLEQVEAWAPERIVVSPGPCTPNEAGISVPLIERFAGRVPILGVCLGHQAIGQAFGGTIVRARQVMHGKVSPIAHDGRGVFEGLPSPFTATRYHSLAIEPSSLPADLEVSARADDGEIMGVRHRTMAGEGVQFHPEAILTEHGRQLLANFLAAA